MNRFNNPLDHVRIAAPCKADWQQMVGTERVRFCGQCNLNVYNLSSMTKTDAETLIVQTEGRLCVRFYRRTDGSILTDNCPVGLRAIRKRLSYVAKGASAAVLTFFAGLGVYSAGTSPPPPEYSIMGLIAMPGISGTSENVVPGMTVTATAEVGQPISSQDLQNLSDNKARRRKHKLRTGPIRSNR